MSSKEQRPQRLSPLASLKRLLSRLFRRRRRAVPPPSRRAALGLQQLESREVLSGYTPTGLEQEFLERLNDARANPTAYGQLIDPQGTVLGGDGRDVRNALAALPPVPPLAFNTSLVQSSRDHSIDMNVNNYFAHNSLNGTTPGQRMAADGYPFIGWEESIAGGDTTVEGTLRDLIVDTYTPDLGHRDQLLSAGGSPYSIEQETGVGVVMNGTGNYQDYYTLDSGNTADARPILLGVVYNDLNANGLYDNGEGVSGVTITATGPGGTYATTAWGSGGYSLRVASGQYTVTASGGQMGVGVSRTVTVGSSNFRLNFSPPVGATATTVTADHSPSAAGQAVTFTATIINTSGNGVKPTGSVEFFDGSTDLGRGSAPAGSGTRVTSTLTTSALSAGAHTLKAVFTSSNKLLGGSQGTLAQTVTVDHLAFATQPGDTVAGQPITPAVQVAVLDRFGNQETGDNSDQVTLKIAGGPAGFAAGSTTTVTVSGGLATFDNLVLIAAGSYTLGVSGTGGLGGAPSTAFTVSAAAADHLAIAPPPPALAGAAISPAVTVRVLDRFGNLVTGDNSDAVTVSVAAGPDAFTGGSTTTATASGGIATFSNLILATPGTYTLAASASGGLGGLSSSSFAVALYADSFARPNSPTLGTSWAQVSGVMGIQGNQLAVTGAGADLAIYRSAALSDTGVQVNIALAGTAPQYAGLVARYVWPGLNVYLAEVVGNQGVFTAYIFRDLNGVYTALASVRVGGAASGLLRFEVVGNSLKLFLNGQLLTYAFDSALSRGTTGVWGSPGARLSNFAGGPVSPVAVALPFSDNFNQPDGSQLSRSWTEQAGNLSVQGGRLRANDPGLNLATVNGPPTADVAVQESIALGTSGTQFAGLVARYSGTGDGSTYLGQVVGSNGHYTAYIFSHVGGTWTMLASSALSGGSGPLLFMVQGSHLTLSFNGTVVCDVTDSAITGPGLAGLRNGTGTLVGGFSVAAL